MKPLKMNSDIEKTAIEEAYVQQLQQGFAVLVENVIAGNGPMQKFENFVRSARQARQIALTLIMDSPITEE